MMSIYEVFLFLFLLLTVLFSRREKRASRWLLFLSAFALIAVAALRDLDVGTDTIHYYMSFHHMRDSNERGESLYYWLVDFFSKYSNYDVFMWFNYSVIIGGVAFIIYHLSDNSFFSLFLYVALGFYTQSFNIMRQYLAISAVFVAVYYFSKNRSKKGLLYFLLAVFIASLIHRTSILGLLFIPILYINNKNIWWYLVLGGSFLIGIVFSSYLTYVFEPLYGLLDDYYDGYLDRANIEASRNIISNAGLNLVGFATLYLAPKESEKKWSVYSLVLSIVLSNLFGWGYLVRVSYLFGIAQIVAIPMVAKTTKNEILRYMYVAFVTLYCIARFYMVTLHTDGIMPYVLR